jgi:hypothetical protein
MPICVSQKCALRRRSTTMGALTSCTLIFNFMRFECGSVQMKLASTNRTFDSPRNLRKHSAINSLLSSAAETQCCGGCRYRSQPLQKCIDASRWIPSEISTFRRIQSSHMAMPVFPDIGAPHVAQRILCGSQQARIFLRDGDFVFLPLTWPSSTARRCGWCTRLLNRSPLFLCSCAVSGVLVVVQCGGGGGGGVELLKFTGGDSSV